MRTFGAVLFVAVVGLPVAGVLTFLLSGFWGWFEATTGIESLGHSGPANWCFGVTYAFVVCLALVGGWIQRKKSARR